MRRLNLIVVLAISFVLGIGNIVSAAPEFDCGGTVRFMNDGNDPDLFIDCFENAVKAKDMELAAKIASELNRMNLSFDQYQRFSKIELKIPKKNYQIYRQLLREEETKKIQSYISDETYDGSGSEGNDTDYYGNAESYVDDFVNAISDAFGQIDTLDGDNWHYERHDTLGDGLVDVFFDVIGKSFFDGSDEAKNAESNADVDALLDECEKYIDRAVDSMKRMMRGDESAVEEMEKYSEKASKLAEELENSTSKMSSSQFKRFMGIIERIITGLF